MNVLRFTQTAEIIAEFLGAPALIGFYGLGKKFGLEGLNSRNLSGRPHCERH